MPNNSEWGSESDSDERSYENSRHGYELSWLAGGSSRLAHDAVRRPSDDEWRIPLERAIGKGKKERKNIVSNRGWPWTCEKCHLREDPNIACQWLQDARNTFRAHVSLRVLLDTKVTGNSRVAVFNGRVYNTTPIPCLTPNFTQCLLVLIEMLGDQCLPSWRPGWLSFVT